MSKYFIYSRKSKATKKGDSVVNQIEMAKRYICSKDTTATDDDIAVFEDDGFSGKNTKRPGFQMMMERIKAGEPEYLIVYRLDRISRSVSDFCAILDLLQKKGIHFVSLNEQFDTKTPMGRVMITISSAFAQMEREVISERVADNMLELSKRGTWMGGRTPAGFIAKRVTANPEHGIMKDHSVLEVDNEQMHIVRAVFNLFEQSRVIRTTRKEIYERYGTKMADFTIKSILTNPVYCAADADAYDYFFKEGATICAEQERFDGKFGMMPYNRHDNGGKVRRDMSEWIIAIGRHEPVVTGKQFVSIQKSLIQNSKDHPRDQAARNNYALLTGLLVCAKCGKKIYTQPQNSGRGPKDNTRFTYVCETRKNFGTSACDCKTISGTRLDSYVLDRICEICDEDSDISKQLEGIRIKRDARKEAGSVKDTIQRQIDLKKKKIDHLIDDLTETEKGSSMYKALYEKINALTDEIGELEKQAKESELLIEDSSNESDTYDLIEQCLTHIAKCRDGMSVAQIRDYLSQVIEKVVWDGEHADIFLYGEE